MVSFFLFVTYLLAYYGICGSKVSRPALAGLGAGLRLKSGTTLNPEP